ncbi:ABC transporter permease [Subtercola boreus]|uniref:ABC transporter permease n=1 Tax=Subtercola boreus TaxID=120213 RepID=A0A3E0W8Q5_9MICO|nr:ABC transporter permease [Subtercola boreus]RFA18590.1 ABC transporter permease [Subtercola boreus]RFA25109.1 ABC transporter permease [Subtercola boreus]
MRALARPWLGGAVGIVLLLVIWAAFSTVLPSSSIVPTPWATAASVFKDFGPYYSGNLASTLGRAGWGYLWGNLAGLLVASIVLIVPRLEEIVTQLGVVSQCLPITAVGPIIILIFGGRSAAIFLAALLVFFTTMIGAILGMRAAPRAALDLVSAYGGSRFTQIRKVQLVSAVPAVFTALAIAVPGALLGAVVGEYLGGIDSGIGVALNAAQRNIDPQRVWGMSILAGLIALLGYALVSLIGRWVTPWVRRGGSH